MLGSKLANLWNAVSHRAADGVKTAEGHPRLYTTLDFLNDVPEFLHTFGRLGVEVDVAAIVDLVNLLDVLDNGGAALGLADET